MSLSVELAWAQLGGTNGVLLVGRLTCGSIGVWVFGCVGCLYSYLGVRAYGLLPTGFGFGRGSV